MSMAIDAQGKPVGDSQFELSLDGLGPRGDDRGRRINFAPNGDMLIWGIEFNVNLIAPAEKIETLYRFSKKNNTWTLVQHGPPGVVNPPNSGNMPDAPVTQ
jgi:hypothetical protein